MNHASTNRFVRLVLKRKIKIDWHNLHKLILKKQHASPYVGFLAEHMDMVVNFNNDDNDVNDEKHDNSVTRSNAKTI